MITLDDVIKSKTFYTGFETYLTKAHCQVTPPPVPRPPLHIDPTRPACVCWPSAVCRTANLNCALLAPLLLAGKSVLFAYISAVREVSDGGEEAPGGGGGGDGGGVGPLQVRAAHGFDRGSAQRERGLSVFPPSCITPCVMVLLTSLLWLLLLLLPGILWRRGPATRSPWAI